MKKSPYQRSCERISWLQFHSPYDKETKERLIRIEEKDQELQEQLTLDGENTGYYDEQ